MIVKKAVVHSFDAKFALLLLSEYIYIAPMMN